jgi:hypothetical protein
MLMPLILLLLFADLNSGALGGCNYDASSAGDGG